MQGVTFKAPTVLRRRLAQEARRRRVSQSIVIRETLEAALLDRPRRAGKLTCADVAAEVIGSFRGPKDLSTSRRYLDEAISGETRRGPKRRR